MNGRNLIFRSSQTLPSILNAIRDLAVELCISACKNCCYTVSILKRIFIPLSSISMSFFEHLCRLTVKQLIIKKE